MVFVFPEGLGQLFEGGGFVFFEVLLIHVDEVVGDGGFWGSGRVMARGLVCLALAFAFVLAMFQHDAVSG